MQPLTMEQCGSVHYITIGDSRLLTAAGLTRSRLYLIGDAASRCGLSQVGYFIPLNGRRPLNGPTPSFTYIMFIIRFIPMYLRLTTFTKTLHQMSFQLYFFLFFSHPCLLTNFTETLTDPQLSATASNVCRLMQAGWRRPGPPPTKILAKPAFPSHALVCRNTL